MIKVFIVDDEAPARDELQYLLEKIEGIEVCGWAKNGRDALVKITEQRPQVVFLDIQMPDMTGIAVARELVNRLGIEHLPLLIFATAFDSHAIEAFEVCAIDYVLKPFSRERLALTLERVKRSLDKGEGEQHKIDKILSLLENKPRQENKLAVEENERIVLIDPKDIIYCSVSGRTARVKIMDREYTCGFTLSELEQKLNLLRTHKSYLVNKQQIREVVPWFNGTYNLIMGDLTRSEVPVSRTFVKQLRNELNF
ncbi:MAG TPA: LytTR family DNA-binding domain-containing protein [Candidatus Deferrimicrobium sp.]|nr:LytTR family DNA-binding domain-containing protein [Candidatus Deferrimicrobium sp.]